MRAAGYVSIVECAPVVRRSFQAIVTAARKHGVPLHIWLDDVPINWEGKFTNLPPEQFDKIPRFTGVISPWSREAYRSTSNWREARHRQRMKLLERLPTQVVDNADAVAASWRDADPLLDALIAGQTRLVDVADPSRPGSRGQPWMPPEPEWPEFSHGRLTITAAAVCVDDRAFREMAKAEGWGSIDAPPPGLRWPSWVDFGALADALDADHPRYAPDLVAALRCWVAVHRPEPGSRLRTQIDLRTHAAKLQVADKGRQAAIATVATPKDRKR